MSWGQEAYYTQSKQSPAPDSSHCNFRVNQVTLSSQGHPWQRPVESIVSTAGHIYGPYWPIWQETLYKMFRNPSAQCEVNGLRVLALSTLHQASQFL